MPRKDKKRSNKRHCLAIKRTRKNSPKKIRKNYSKNIHYKRHKKFRKNSTKHKGGRSKSPWHPEQGIDLA